MLRLLMTFFILLIASLCQADLKPRGLPNLPTSGLGIKGSVGVGFTDFTILDPTANFSLDRGTYTTLGLQRGFDAMNLYFTMSGPFGELKNNTVTGKSIYEVGLI